MESIRKSDLDNGRFLVEAEESLTTLQTQMQKLQKEIIYSSRYCDEYYDYRHVFLPPALARMVPGTHLMTESEWRNLGVQQSIGWEHYMIHNPGDMVSDKMQ